MEMHLMHLIYHASWLRNPAHRRAPAANLPALAMTGSCAQQRPTPPGERSTFEIPSTAPLHTHGLHITPRSKSMCQAIIRLDTRRALNVPLKTARDPHAGQGPVTTYAAPERRNKAQRASRIRLCPHPHLKRRHAAAPTQVLHTTSERGSSQSSRVMRA